MELTILLYENGYPPEWDEEVFEKVMDNNDYVEVPNIVKSIEEMLKQHHLNIKEYKLYRINANKVMNFGDVDVSFFNTTHSLPETIGISINTKDGSIVYCTDFNFSSVSNYKYRTTFEKITDLGKNKVLALLAESVNAGVSNRVTTDTLLEHHYKSVLLENNKRIFVAAYVSDLIRIQKIIKSNKINTSKVFTLIEYGLKKQKEIEKKYAGFSYNK